MDKEEEGKKKLELHFLNYRFRIEDLADKKNLNQQLVCYICKDLVYDPMECRKCQTFFCSNCIRFWRLDNDQCPNKCAGYFQVQAISGYWKHALLKLDINCKDCQRMFEYGFYLQHLQLCQEKVIQCSYLKCPHYDKRKNIEYHQINCKYSTLYSQLYTQLSEDTHQKIQKEIQYHKNEIKIKHEQEKKSLKFTRTLCPKLHNLQTQNTFGTEYCDFCKKNGHLAMTTCILCYVFICNDCHFKLPNF